MLVTMRGIAAEGTLSLCNEIHVTLATTCGIPPEMCASLNPVRARVWNHNHQVGSGNAPSWGELLAVYRPDRGLGPGGMQREHEQEREHRAHNCCGVNCE